MRSESPSAPRNQHFISVGSWQAAAAELAFEPVPPRQTLGYELTSLCIHVRDHRLRDLAVNDRSLEAHYGAFVITQQLISDPVHAHDFVVGTRYGAEPAAIQIAGYEGRSYELGPPVDANDPDGRAAAVVVWCDGAIGHLIASTNVGVAKLRRVAASIDSARA